MRPHIAYGGSFDPVHCGHIAVARLVASYLDGDVWLVPAAEPPHKAGTHAGATHRRRMLELAVAGQPGLRVDPRELERAGRSYTVDTLAGMRAELGDDTPLVWVVGADSLLQLHRWDRWRELFRLAHVLAVTRPGSVVDVAALSAASGELAAEVIPRLRPPAGLRQAPAGFVAILPIDPLRLESSTQLRERIQAGGAWRQLVPDAVAAYIDRHRLYAPGDAA